MKTLQSIIDKHEHDIKNADIEGNYEGFTYLERLYGKLECANENILKLWNDLSYSKTPVSNETIDDILDEVAETIEEVMSFINDLSQLDVNQCDTEN